MPAANKDKSKILSTNLFPVVGIGASAGGLDSFKRLIKAIPEKSGMAYILVQHLDPSHESILVDILQKFTHIPIYEITDNMIVASDNIYIIPANKLLTATDGVLRLSPRVEKIKNASIDIFFRSLAEVHQDHSVGVLLSGTGTDGATGLKDIKDHGGITFAQDPGSSPYPAMPQNAIDSGVVDFILSPPEIAKRLLEINGDLVSFDKSKDENSSLPQRNAEVLKQILSLIRIRQGADFTYYKQTTIWRRIVRRMALKKLQTPEDYLLFLKKNQEEQDIFFLDLLIPVTSFFRDPKTFELLCNSIFPLLFENKLDNKPVRIWNAGCSTGEEAYSFAICMKEYLGDDSETKIQIFATDLSQTSITKARSGLYSERDVKDLSIQRLKKYFTKVDDDHYLVNKEIRNMCVFACHNILKDPPFVKMDLISCRNVLIYMENFLQKKALTTFHYALNEKCFLLLGKSETIGSLSDLFIPYGKQDKIYTRKAGTGKYMAVASPQSEKLFSEAGNKEERKEIFKSDFQKTADEILLAKYTPPGVVVNDQLDIVHFRGATGTFLEPSPGKASLQLLKMVSEGLAFELRNAMHKAKQSNEPVKKESILLNNGKRSVAIEVVPLPGTVEPHFLILFLEETSSLHNPAVMGKNHEASAAGKKIKDLKEYKIQQLEKEIMQAREDMRRITEDQEAANEELQSANEELLSGSEELQTLNEELQTSKEELQSTNEELVIVNHQLLESNSQLNEARKYSEAIVTTIRTPLVVLDASFRVQSANAAFCKTFQINEEDTREKLLYELQNQQWEIPALRTLLEKILPDKSKVTDFEFTHRSDSTGERILCLNGRQVNRENKDEPLILLSIEDITERKQGELKLKNFLENLEQIIEARTELLNEANTNLVRSNINLKQFAYLASHDLQEPLRKIQTFARLLEERSGPSLPENIRKYIDKIVDAASRMSILIKDILDYSRMGNEEEAFVKTDLNKILNEVIADFDLIINQKKGVINKGELPSIEAVPSQMHQLFHNLISNALKFTKEDIPPVIDIRSKMLPVNVIREHPNLNQELSYCEITVTDNGIGFNPDYAEKIFLIFQRLHGHDKYPGTGIGLALCLKMALNNHGEIFAKSQKNEGASFHVVLPMKQANKTKDQSNAGLTEFISGQKN